MPSPATEAHRNPMSRDDHVDGPILTAYRLDAAEYREVGCFAPDDEADLDIGPAPVRFRPADLLA